MGYFFIGIWESKGNLSGQISFNPALYTEMHD